MILSDFSRSIDNIRVILSIFNVIDIMIMFIFHIRISDKKLLKTRIIYKINNGFSNIFGFIRNFALVFIEDIFIMSFFQ